MSMADGSITFRLTTETAAAPLPIIAGFGAAIGALALGPLALGAVLAAS